MENTANLETMEIPSVLTQIEAPALVTLIVSKELNNLSATRKLADYAFLSGSGNIAIVHPEGQEDLYSMISSIVGDDEEHDAKVLLIDTVYDANSLAQSLPELTAAQLGLLTRTQNCTIVFLTEKVSAAIEQDSHVIAEVVPEDKGKYLLTVSKHRTANPGIYPFSL